MSLKSRLAKTNTTNVSGKNEFVEWSTRIAANMKNDTFHKLDIRHLIGELSTNVETGMITLHEAENVFLSRINDNVQ